MSSDKETPEGKNSSRHGARGKPLNYGDDFEHDYEEDPALDVHSDDSLDDSGGAPAHGRNHGDVEEDEKWMRRAIALARNAEGDTYPNPIVGACVVKDGKLISEGWHKLAGLAHAERVAIMAAKKQHGEDACKDATIYVTLEPCSHFGKTPPCADLIIESGIKRAVIAIKDPNPLVNSEGIRKLKDAGIEVVTGVLKREAFDLNKGFFSLMTRKRPWLTLKMAMSLDGKTALSNNESKWITSSRAREDSHFLRKRSDVILTGLASVLADDSRLNVRLPNVVRQPARCVLDPSLSIPEDLFVITDNKSSTIIATGTDMLESTNPQDVAKMERLKALEHVELMGVTRTPQGRVNLENLLLELGNRGHQFALCEAGATLAGSFLEADLVDELVLYYSPKILGSDARDPFLTTKRLSKVPQDDWEIRDAKIVGGAIKMRLTRLREPFDEECECFDD